MRISYLWLQDYFEEKLPSPEKLGELLTMHAFEIESIEKIGEDSVLDIKVLPDRSHDCLSHRGIALEVALLSGMQIKDDIRTLPEQSALESNVLKVEVLDTKLCKRFSALVMEHIEVNESPQWLKERLEAIGQRSINNIVDATNYVMFALGQPLHAYDRDLLKEEGEGWKIVVRTAHEGETLAALDNKEYSLTEGQLCIVDGNTNKALGIAGIKGGKASQITKNTKHIIIEAANFEPVNIRKSAKKIGLRTDASVRFENEITPELTTLSLRAVSDLIFQIAGTKETQVEGMIDVYPRKANQYTVGVSHSEIRSLLGIELSEDDVKTILNREGFVFEYIDPVRRVVDTAESYIGTPYAIGASVTFDAPKLFDCSSFTAYLFSQAGVAIPRMSVDQYVFGAVVNESEIQPGDLVFSNSNEGKILYESIEWKKGTPVPEGVDHVGLYAGNGYVVHATRKTGKVVKEKISESASFQHIVGYRRMYAGEKRFVIKVPFERLDLRLKEDIIEEIGRIYGYATLAAKEIQHFAQAPEIEKKQYYAHVLRNICVSKGYSEVITYAFRTSGEVELQNPLASDKAFLRNNLSSGLQESYVLNTRNKDLLGLSEVKIFEIGNVFTKDGEFFSFGFAGGKEEEMSRDVSDALGVTLAFTKTGDVYEVLLDEVLEKLPNPTEPYRGGVLSDTKFSAYSSYPAIFRDIAVFVPEGDNQHEIIEVIQTESHGLLVQHRLFDTFTKDFDGIKKTSFAYRLVFQSMEKTLTDDEINPIMMKVTEILNSKSGWQVR